MKKSTTQKKITKTAVPSKTATGKTPSKSLPSPKHKTAAKPAPKQTATRKPAAAAKTPAKPRAQETPRKKAPAAPPPKKSPEKDQPPTDRMRSLRRALIEKREQILREAKGEIAKYISGETRQLVDTALDEGDWAVVDISEDINLRRLSSHQRLMRDIDESLRKISEGTYGICEECSEEISEKRLRVLPTATLCVDCQENQEKLEAIEKESEIP